MSTKTVVLFGSSGATGSKLLPLLIQDQSIGKIILFNRKSLKKTLPSKVDEHVLPDLNKLPKLENTVDSVITCLGTTLKKAGSVEAFTAIDKHLICSIAEWTKANNIQELHVISSIGANASSSNYYLKVKGEMEEEVKKIGVESLHFYRPSLLVADRDELRLKEKVSETLFQIVSNISDKLRKYEPVHVEQLARFIHYSLFSISKGEVVHSSENINQLNIMTYQDYFKKEKKIYQFLIGLGSLTGVIGTGILLVESTELLKGIALPALISSGIFILGGAYLLGRIPKQLKTIQKEIDLKETESESNRMEKVVNTFHKLISSEIILFIGGTLISILAEQAYIKGVGIGVIISSLTLFKIDNYLINNAKKYLNWFRSRSFIPNGK